MGGPFSRIEDAINKIAAGGVAIVLDSEDRENEGDFIAAAEKTSPQVIHFMISQGRGQLCMPVLPELAKRLELEPMVKGKNDGSLPRFAVPIDHIGCKTGISPLERTLTIQMMLEVTSEPEDFVRPGHVFPLVACEGGVLERPGHTEAAIELARLAGLAPAGVLCEVCSRDGLHMAGLQELVEMAEAFGLPLITIDDLAEFRRREMIDHPRRVESLNALAATRSESAAPRDALPTAKIQQ